MNLRFADFSVLSESEGLRTEKRAFFPATWGGQHLPVTLMVSKDMALNNINIKNSFALTPIAQFVDQVPSYLVAHALGESNTGNNQGKHLIPLLIYRIINKYLCRLPCKLDIQNALLILPFPLLFLLPWS